MPGGGALCGQRVARKLDPDPWRLGVLVPLSSDSRTGTQLAICAASSVRRTQSVVSSVQLLATVRGPPGGRTQLTWPSSSRSEGQCPPLFRVVMGLLLSCVMVDVLHCMDLGITAHVEPPHARRTVNESTTRSALGTDRKERSPNSKES